MVTGTPPSDRSEIAADYARARRQLRDLVGGATPADLRRRSNGTRWNNEQLLFHMVFGYMVVQALLPLVRVVSRLPAPVGRGFAAVLNAGTRPFDFVNYWGSCAAALVFNRHRMAAKFDRVSASLLRRLDRESDRDLARGMPFPTRWDPFFLPTMTLGQLYAYPTQHFDFHRAQLSL
jgi:hypothetical protein